MMSSEIAALLSVSGYRSPGNTNGRPVVTAQAAVYGTAQAATEEAQGNREEAVEAIEQLNEFSRSIGRDLKFSIDEDLGRIIITVTDIETDEVIRMIPGEEALKIAKHIQQYMSLMLDEEA